MSADPTPAAPRDRRSASRILAWTSLAAVAAIAWWNFDRNPSPGPLHPSHAAVARLSGNAGCALCHADGQFDGAERFDGTCNSCHEDVADQLARRTGIHGALEPWRAVDCTECHHEHAGDTLDLVSTAAFQRAGVPAPEIYDHAHAGGLALEGRHLELDCTGCHVFARNDMVPEGASRYLGLSQACTACHSDAHRGELGNDCARCHGQERPFREVPNFQHPKSFPLIDGHAGRRCSECHATPDVYTGLSTRCASCHGDDYEATTRPSHRLAGLGNDCAECHGSRSWSETRFVHPARLPLAGAHAAVACASCHGEGGLQERTAAFARSQRCTECHASPHDPRLIAAAGEAQSGRGDACTVCHAPSLPRWRDADETAMRSLHGAVGFSLEAPHASQACAECHESRKSAAVNPTVLRSGADWRRDFPGRSPNGCEACHRDPHAGQFDAGESGGACAACHAPTAFTPTQFDMDRHATCGFPIDGSHRAVACASCHTVVDGVRRFAETPSACADCHADPHGGVFDRAPDGAERPQLVDGRSGCARCHTTVDFAKVAWTPADHALWTGEALTGKHASASCSDCHRRASSDDRPVDPSVPPPSARRIPKFTPAPRECAACHDDVHAGQFATGGAPDASTDCARCHRSTESFRTVAFDHGRDSRFALDADHAKLACSACHRPVEFAGRSVVRFKPLGVECADCHDPRGGRPARPIDDGPPRKGGTL